jgi:DNA repair exonuclease SbcCD nuclease subunit
VIVAHLSDLHLGHRAFDRTEGGQNLRELDLAAAFQRAVDDLVRLRPDVVVVAGDVFDRPDPPPGALVALTRGLERIGGELPGTPVLIAAGARDTPRRSGEAGALAAMDAFPHVEAATGTARSVLFRERSLHVHLVPHRSVLRGRAPVLEPDPRARWNVLVVHGRLGSASDASDASDDAVALDLEGWDYVALGSSHSHRVVAPRVAYAGALERVGPAPWAEAAEQKGFVTVDLETGRLRFHVVPGRAVVSLAPTRVPRRDPEALRARVAEVVREVPGGIDGKIVRIRLRGPTPSDLAALQGPFLVDLARRALHLSVEAEDAGGAAEHPPPDLTALVDAHLPAAPPTGTHLLLERVLQVGA